MYESFTLCWLIMFWTLVDFIKWPHSFFLYEPFLLFVYFHLTWSCLVFLYIHTIISRLKLLNTILNFIVAQQQSRYPLPPPQVWDASSGSLLQKLPADLPVLDISPFAMNGEHFLASLTEKMLKLYRWEWTRKQGPDTVPQHKDRIWLCWKSNAAKPLSACLHTKPNKLVSATIDLWPETEHLCHVCVETHWDSAELWSHTKEYVCYIYISLRSSY